MASTKHRINEYLFYEFGFEEDVASVSETWPFHLTEVQQCGPMRVFEFEDDVKYYALLEPSLTFLPACGMSVSDLSIQHKGSTWVGERDPIDLTVSRPGDDSIPSGIERRKALDRLVAVALPTDSPVLLEGLFLTRERQYVALAGIPEKKDAFVVGLSPRPVVVGFPEASAWRRLAWGVGRWLSDETAQEEDRTE